jgi:hypothetical protein
MSGRTTAVARFNQHVDRNGAVHPKLGTRCWLWTAYIRPNGYGRFMVAAGVAEYAHRFAYETAVGPIPEGKKLDHLCENRACVNPDHLEPVTQVVNLMRSERTLPRKNSEKTHCNYGHSDWYQTAHGRRCRTCKAIRRKAGARGITFTKYIEEEQKWQARTASA